jgi:hypothetical protein
MGSERRLITRDDRDHWNEWVPENKRHGPHIHLSVYEIHLSEKQYFRIHIGDIIAH